jgi:DNA mismatch repair protein MutL
MIVQLPKILIDQIAAGEVVVRPASVVKELVENSIDARARHVTVAVGNALRDITVTDDGIGMGREDARLALERHATSKIRSLADLQALRTRGFRGEALPSIAAVSRLTLTTRPAGDVAATRIVVEGGDVLEVATVGAPPGTQVVARELFFNTPARLNFLKGPATELGQLSRVLVRQALAEPAVAFRMLNQERLFLDLPADQSLDSRTQQLLGVKGENLLRVEFEKYELRVWGHVAKPLEARRDRRHQFFFVNGRPISHRTLAYSVQQAFEGLLMTQRFPVVVLFIDVAPDQVDVNVHPTKEEVRFRDENKINGLVCRAVQEALHAANLMPQLALPKLDERRGEPPVEERSLFYVEQFRQASQGLQIPAPPYERLPLKPVTSRPEPVVVIPEAECSSPTGREGNECSSPTGREGLEAEPAKAGTTNLPAGPTNVEAGDVQAHSEGVVIESAFPGTESPRALGQIADTYIIAQAGDDLLLIDQHAAHERLLYARAREQAEGGATQPLLVPIAVEVRPADRPLMEELAPVLEAMGFETEAFGGQTFIVRSVPAAFDHVDVPAFVTDLLDDLAGEGRARETDRVRELVFTRLACHAAIRAGRRLQPEEMQRLIDDLVAARLSFTCPHGRPTMIRLTRDQLDRQFKRK